MPEKSLVFTVLGIDKASRVFDKVGQSMERLGTTAIKSLAGITGGSAAAAAGVAAAVAGLPVAFAGLGAAALKENTRVRQSFEGLSETVRTGLMADAAPLESAFVNAAHKMGAAYTQLRPQMAAAFLDAAPHVDTLIDGVTEFAVQAMPGMVRSVRSAGPVMEGLRNLMRDAGVGVDDFFTILSEGSVDAGQGIQHLGQLIRTLLPATAGALVEMSGLWAQHGDEVVTVVQQLIGVLGQLSGGALPVVSDAVGAALDVLSGILTVIEPMAGAIGPVIGAWLSLAVAMKGMRAVQGVVDTVGASVGRFRDNMATAAGPGGAGKLATTVGGVASLFGGPWGVAVAGAAAVLSIFGARSQEAAADQRTLTAALRESGGEFDSNARAALVNTEAYKDVADQVGKAGLSHGQFVDALVSGGPALDALKTKLRETVDAETELVTTDQGVVAMTGAKGEAASSLLGAIDGLRGGIQGAVGDFQREESAVAGASGAMTNAVPGSDALREAIKTLGDATADTASHVDALNEAWRIMFGLALTTEEATAAWEASLDTLREALDQTKESTKNWRGELFAADGQINLSTEKGRQLSTQLMQTGDDYRALAQTAYDTALRQSGSQQHAAAVAVDAANRRRAQFLAEAQQMGFNAGEAQRLANRYLGLPDDVLTIIRGDAGPAWAAINDITRRQHTAWITMQTRIARGLPAISDMKLRAEGGPIERFAAGGQFRRARSGTQIGPGGPRDDKIRLLGSAGEFMVNARATQKNRGALEYINSGGTLPHVVAGGGSGAKRVVLEFAGGRDEFSEMMGQLMRRYVRVRGGDVQAVIGGAG